MLAPEIRGATFEQPNPEYNLPENTFSIAF
jgi:hypothetical protein